MLRFVAVAFTMVAVVIGGGVVAEGVSLSSLLEPGQTLRLSDKVFSNFSFAPGTTVGTGTIDAADAVDVTVLGIGGHVAIRFDLQASATAVSGFCGPFLLPCTTETGEASGVLDFDVTVVDSPEVIVGVTVAVGGEFPGATVSAVQVTSQFSDPAFLGMSVARPNTAGITPLADATTMLHVSSTALVAAFATVGEDETATLNGITFIFDQESPIDAAPVPEAGSLRLVVIGGAVVAAVRWRKFRSRAAMPSPIK